MATSGTSAMRPHGITSYDTAKFMLELNVHEERFLPTLQYTRFFAQERELKRLTDDRDRWIDQLKTNTERLEYVKTTNPNIVPVISVLDRMGKDMEGLLGMYEYYIPMIEDVLKDTQTKNDNIDQLTTRTKAEKMSAIRDIKSLLGNSKNIIGSHGPTDGPICLADRYTAYYESFPEIYNVPIECSPSKGRFCHDQSHKSTPAFRSPTVSLVCSKCMARGCRPDSWLDCSVPEFTECTDHATKRIDCDICMSGTSEYRTRNPTLWWRRNFWSSGVVYDMEKVDIMIEEAYKQNHSYANRPLDGYRFALVTPSNTEQVSECPVCMSRVCSDPVRPENCSHYFCKVCIKTWLDAHETCPCCRTPVRKYY